MKSEARPEFWQRYRSLPPTVRRAAVKQYQLWRANPFHPSVNFKKIGRFWSARVTDDYRAVGVLEQDTVIWFWIGGHAEYERLLRGR